VARSGESASFLVGGEVPIPIAQGGAFGSITVEYKPFGVGLSFTPTVLAPDRIHLKVSPEVSQPDFTFGTEVEGTVVPAFNSRRATTSVELKHGQSLVIAGLLSEELREQVSQYPVLGQIPILGGLFRSSKFEKNQTELVIIVTPALVKPLGRGPHPLPTDHFIEPSAAEFYLYGWLEGRAPAEETPAGLIGEAGYRISPTPKEASDE
jgi:pilus assembly protein CpaC